MAASTCRSSERASDGRRPRYRHPSGALGAAPPAKVLGRIAPNACVRRAPGRTDHRGQTEVRCSRRCLRERAGHHLMPMVAFDRRPRPSSIRNRRTFFGVEHSLTGRRWPERLGAGVQWRPRDRPEACDAGLVARVLAGRGVPVDDVPGFLAPTLKALMPDPAVLTDMDGRRNGSPPRSPPASRSRSSATTTSTARLRRRCSRGSCAHQGATRRIYIPDRIFEGYGPNVEAMKGACRSRGARSSSPSTAAPAASTRSRRPMRSGSTPSSSTTTRSAPSCRRHMRWSIRTGRTIFPGSAISRRRASPS